MAKEIERRFLLKGLPDIVSGQKGSTIHQGYIFTEADYPLRVRSIKDNTSESFWITRKEGIGLVREENEEQISEAVFNLLWPATEPYRIKKIRYKAGRWEIDEFQERVSGLVIAEIELKSAREKITIPKSIKKELVEEITGSEQYSNSTIAIWAATD